MIKALTKKEWKKTKYVILAFSIITLISLVFIHLDIKNALEFNNPSDILLNTINKESLNIDYYKLAILAIGGFIGFFQFSPEVSKARIRLHLHLPVKQSRLINFLIIYGLLAILIVFLISNIIFYFSVTQFYPIELFYAFQTKIIVSLPMSIIWYLSIAIFLIQPLKIMKVGILALSILITLLYSATTGGFFLGNNMYLYSIVIIASYYLLLLNAFNTYTKGYIK